ncbi:hypothetical protein DYE48_10255 [Halobacillus trueperi]|uniref:Uncharacterized protein n=1 Tax=Halobacillus trueperi TaxID=156205 RepID=A0A3E0J969_9BACI|nr:hypothetical protein DYE48_10255 [Halobacillus trueperi]
MGSFLTFMVGGGWEAARLPWEKEIGEIPQDVVRGSSPLPHRKASCFPTIPDTQPSNESRKHLEIESSRILPFS